MPPESLREAALRSGRPEALWLLRAASVGTQADPCGRLQPLAAAETDWAALIRMAARHALVPLLCRHLKTACPEQVPAATMAELDGACLANTRRNLGLTRELFRLLNLFEANGILAIPFKGPALAAVAYGDLSLRQFVDLDIMVLRNDVLKARDLLVALGYRPRYGMSAVQERLLLLSNSEYPLENSRQGLLVELLWRIVPRNLAVALDTESVREHLVSVSVGGRELRTVSSEVLLLLLCIHGAKHFWMRLAWISDVARLLQARPPLDWAVVVNLARRFGCLRILHLGLLLAGDLLGAEVPGEILARVRDDGMAHNLAVRIAGEIFSEPRIEPGVFRCLRFHLQMRERLRDRMRCCVETLFTPGPEDCVGPALPACLFPLYFLLRPARLAVEYAARPFRGRSTRLRATPRENRKNRDGAAG